MDACALEAPPLITESGGGARADRAAAKERDYHREKEGARVRMIAQEEQPAHEEEWSKTFLWRFGSAVNNRFYCLNGSTRSTVLCQRNKQDKPGAIHPSS